MNRKPIFIVFSGTNITISIALIVFAILFNQYWLFVVTAILFAFVVWMFRWYRRLPDMSEEDQSSSRILVFGLNFVLMVLVIICFYTALHFEIDRSMKERVGEDACITIYSDEGCRIKSSPSSK